MVQHLQLERKESLIVLPGENLVFDNEVSIGGDKISYDQITGEIEFTQEGVYYLSWFVAQQTGLSPLGSNFGIVSSDENDEDIIASNHVKISSTTGFAIITVPSGGKTISLINETAHGAALSETALVKAGLAVFEVSEGTGPGPQPEPLPVGFIHVQVVDAAVNVNDDEIIIFNSIISQDGDDIVEYDNLSGVFTIIDPPTKHRTTQAA